MSIGSNVLGGIDCQITINAKSGTTYAMGGRIANYNKAGFERGIEYKACQGRYFENRKPITPADVSFDVILDVDSNAGSLTFDDIAGSYSLPYSGIRKNELSETYNYYKIKLEWINYTGTYGTLGTNDESYKEIFYNARGLSFDKKSDSSGYLTGTMKFIVVPFNELGSCNYMESEKVIGTATTNYTTLETNKDTEMGY